MANGQQKAEQYVNSFISWSATMKDNDYKQITYRGNLSRIEVAKAVGCAKSSLLQNPRLKTLLSELEDDLRERSILPPLTESAKSNQSKPKQYDKTASKRLQDSKRISELEQEVLRLKMQLERFTELSEVMAELGLDES
ncbi:MAG: VPA1267 family protein [Psychrobium sp.]